MFASLFLLEFISTIPILLLYQLSTVHQNVCEIEACDILSDFVYRIEKYIYGLPDSGRVYYQAYSKLLIDSGYIKSRRDPCLFLKFYPDSGDCIYIWVHVDDTFTAATSTVYGYLTSSRLLSNLNSRVLLRAMWIYILEIILTIFLMVMLKSRSLSYLKGCYRRIQG